MDKEYLISTENSVKFASMQRHHREKFWQILFPIAVSVILIIIAAVFVILIDFQLSDGGSVSQWADVSIIWLVLPIMMFAVFGTLVLAGLIYLVSKLLNILPPYSNLIQEYASLITTRVNLVTRKLVSPLVSAKSIKAGMGGFLSSLFRLNQK
ncbi:MAG: hypothetical protein SVP52_08100 [Chloroflexota bacterium]|nr:hypothetical protein [Chloroflexota bacterium]